jgi:2-polyprenyl-3-methyl-5-hydroxy-6-metoxy-1,4-benzoquinol methylase
MNNNILRRSTFDAQTKDVSLSKPYFAFVLNRLARLFPGRKDIRVLDYGCGDGTLVRFLIDSGYDAYGVDIDSFFEDFYSYTDPELLSRKRISVIDLDGRGDLSGKTFDFTVSNMVVEHVADKRRFFKALASFMHSSSIALLLYPVRESVREGHIRQYFIHWLPKGPLRVAAAYAQKVLGIPPDNGGAKNMREYIREKILTVDKHCSYESTRGIDRCLGECFKYSHIEHDYFVFRAVQKGKQWLIPPVQALGRVGLSGPIFRMYTGAVVEARLKARA